MVRANMYNYDDKLDEQDFEEMCEETNNNYIQDLKDKLAKKDIKIEILKRKNEILDEALDKIIDLFLGDRTFTVPQSRNEIKNWLLESVSKK